MPYSVWLASERGYLHASFPRHDDRAKPLTDACFRLVAVVARSIKDAIAASGDFGGLRRSQLGLDLSTALIKSDRNGANRQLLISGNASYLVSYRASVRSYCDFETTRSTEYGEAGP